VTASCNGVDEIAARRRELHVRSVSQGNLCTIWPSFNSGIRSTSGPGPFSKANRGWVCSSSERAVIGGRQRRQAMRGRYDVALLALDNEATAFSNGDYLAMRHYLDHSVSAASPGMYEPDGAMDPDNNDVPKRLAFLWSMAEAIARPEERWTRLCAESAEGKQCASRWSRWACDRRSSSGPASAGLRPKSCITEFSVSRPGADSPNCLRLWRREPLP
jgi:hypothetical protein